MNKFNFLNGNHTASSSKLNFKALNTWRLVMRVSVVIADDTIHLKCKSWPTDRKKTLSKWEKLTWPHRNGLKERENDTINNLSKTMHWSGSLKNMSCECNWKWIKNTSTVRQRLKINIIKPNCWLVHQRDREKKSTHTHTSWAKADGGAFSGHLSLDITHAWMHGNSRVSH